MRKNAAKVGKKIKKMRKPNIPILNLRNMKKLIHKTIALTLAASLLIQSFLPQRLYAIGGPAQPEFSNFEAVGASGLVNEFNGAFIYNIPVIEIPGIEGGGYALSLSYHSGISPDEDASWVGYGWTLNPGSYCS